MSDIVRRRPVQEGLQQMLESATSRPVGIGRAPEKENGDQEPYPFIVIIPRQRGHLTGGLYENSWSMGELEFTVKSVGERPDQTQELADRVMASMIGKNDDQQYTFDLDVGTQMKVMERRPDTYSPGALLPVGSIFEVDDSFVIAVTAR